MITQNVLNALALGELSNLSMAEQREININSIPQVVQHINDGLLRLYTRFVLKERDLILEIREGITNYHLLKRYAYSQYDPLDPPESWDMPYILDLEKEPFRQDVVKILAVYNSNGKKLPLNDIERPDSVFTPQGNVLQIPHNIPCDFLSIGYQATHPEVPSDDLTKEIELPEVLYGALRAYVAYRVFSNMNTAESTSKSQEHLMMYETLCQEVISNDLVSTSVSSTNSRFDKAGWV